MTILAEWIFFGVAYCHAAGPTIIPSDTHITSETIWTKEDSPYLLKGAVYVEAPLIIKPGTVVKLAYGTGRMEVWSKFTAVGTPDNRIIFTSARDDSFAGDSNKDGDTTKPSAGDWGHIMFASANCDAEIEYASFFYGSRPGGVDGIIAVNATDKVNIKNSEIKYGGYSGLFIYEAQPTIENNIISNNKIGILSWSRRVPIVRWNSIIDNESGALVIGLLTNRFDAKENWWGSRTGPYNATLNPGGKGNKVDSKVLFDPWLGKDPNHIRKPVILIPGIGGTVNWDLMLGSLFTDNWKLMSHTYDGIIQAFQNMGYQEGKDFFICYYDWRKKNLESAADFLAPLISKANNLNGTTKVNIVAHSMGGILARSYIQSNEYRNDVENLIMIGTPNKGSSDAYPVWEGGYIPKNWENRVIFIGYLDYLRAKNVTPSAYKSVHQFIPSVKELLPLYDYIHPKDDPQNLKSYLSMQERNDWLANLDNEIGELNQKVKVSVISGNGYPTVNNIPVIEAADESPLWIDGKPDPIDPERNDVRGDKRVLLSSSEIENTFKDILDFDHGEIVDQVESIIAKRLNEEIDKIFESPPIDNELAFWFASPVNVEIEDPIGRIINKDIEDLSNEKIPLAIYSGESKPDGFKFISIPNPVKGEYKIKLEGNGNGEYHAGSIYVDYENNVPDQESEVEGTINKGEIKEYKVEYNPENTEDPIGNIEPFDTTPPTITITFPKDQEIYLNDQYNLSLGYEITDNVSQTDRITKTIEYDGKSFTESQIDLSLESLGKHTFKITAADEAGNPANEEITFQITTNLEAIQNNLNHYYFDLGLIKKEIAYKYLSRKLKNLEKLFDLLEKIENSKLNPEPKQEAIEALKKIINADIDRLVRQIKRKSPHWIKSGVASFLIESMDYIKIK